MSNLTYRQARAFIAVLALGNVILAAALVRAGQVTPVERRLVIFAPDELFEQCQ